MTTTLRRQQRQRTAPRGKLRPTTQDAPPILPGGPAARPTGRKVRTWAPGRPGRPAGKSNARAARPTGRTVRIYDPRRYPLIGMEDPRPVQTVTLQSRHVRTLYHISSAFTRARTNHEMPVTATPAIPVRPLARRRLQARRSMVTYRLLLGTLGPRQRLRRYPRQSCSHHRRQLRRMH